MSDAEQEHLRFTGLILVVEIMADLTRAHQVRGRWFGEYWIGAGSSTFHDSLAATVSLLNTRSGDHRLTGISATGCDVAVFDIGDMCPPSFGHPLPNRGFMGIEKFVSIVLVETRGEESAQYWGGQATADLLKAIRRTYLEDGPHELPSDPRKLVNLFLQPNELQEFPGRLVARGSKEWIDSVARTIERERVLKEEFRRLALPEPRLGATRSTP